MCFYFCSFCVSTPFKLGNTGWKGYDAIIIIRSILFVVFLLLSVHVRANFLAEIFVKLKIATIKVNANELQAWILFNH